VPQLEVLEDRDVPALTITSFPLAQTPSILVNKIAGPGVAISNVRYTGVAAAAGTFTQGAPAVGIDSGIILSTGIAVQAGPGPNNFVASTNNGQPGDIQLSQLIGGTVTFDAAELQFDFVPKARIMTLRYVFASDEYNTFVGLGFTDVVGIFLNGRNLAHVPGTTVNVSIDTVNKIVNSQFFRDNDPADFGGIRPLGTVMNGLTTVFTITANVNIGVPNHLKIAIADATDAVFDSVVFVQASSFQAQINPVVYFPLRYTFNPHTGTYDGFLTIINFGAAALTVPTVLVVPTLPAGVTVSGATTTFPGFVGTSVIPFPVSTLPGGATLHLYVHFTDPFHLPLPNYFSPPAFFVEVVQM